MGGHAWLPDGWLRAAACVGPRGCLGCRARQPGLSCAASWVVVCGLLGCCSWLPGWLHARQGWRNELKPGGATFDFSFSFTGAFRACDVMTCL